MRTIDPAAPRLQWIREATDIVMSGPSTPQVSLSDSALWEAIDETLDIASLVTGDLPGDFFDWIVDALNDFKELLDDFTGDASQIKAHAEHCHDVAGLVAVEGPPIGEVIGMTGQWTGPAATAFGRTTYSSAACIRTTSDALHDMGNRHLAIGVALATIKEHLIETVTGLAVDLVERALEAIADVGLALVDGAWSVVSGAIQEVKNGSIWSAPANLVKGAVGGADDAADKVADAFDAFVSFAADVVAETLGAVTDFTDGYLGSITTEIGQLKGIGERAERAAAVLVSGDDPGYNADGPDDGTIGANSRGTGMQERDRDLIDLNQSIGDPDATLPKGYRRATPDDLAALGLTPELLNDDNGFIAEVFVDKDGNYVMAFAGTGAGGDSDLGATGTDAGEDGVGAFTVSPQTQNVLEITERISSSPNADDVMFTGHSLGGRLASVASLDTGNGAVTYNAAGVSQPTIDYVAASNNTTAEALTDRANDGQVRRYHTGSDPLTAAQEGWSTRDAAPDALGHPIQLGEDDPLPLEGHTNDVVEKEFDKAYPAG